MLAPTLQYRLFIMRKIELNKWLRFWFLVTTWNQIRKHVWKKDRYEWRQECVCDCWNIVYVPYYRLISWKTKSCWCYSRIVTSKVRTTHWDSWNRLYEIWMWIKKRCLNKNSYAYNRYWWRWITICEERLNYENFKKDMLDSYNDFIKIHWEKNTTIDRIDNDKWYNKENCKWSTAKQQANNRSSNRKIIYKWKEYKSVSLLCEDLWLCDKYTLIENRISKWRSIERAISEDKHLSKRDS